MLKNIQHFDHVYSNIVKILAIMQPLKLIKEIHSIS